jgi:hypothetical protein
VDGTRSIERIPLADWSEFSGLASLGAIHCVGIGLGYLDWEYKLIVYDLMPASLMIVNQVLGLEKGIVSV